MTGKKAAEDHYWIVKTITADHGYNETSTKSHRQHGYPTIPDFTFCSLLPEKNYKINNNGIIYYNK